MINKYDDPLYKVIPFKSIQNPMKDLRIKPIWKNVQEFADWWLTEKMPIVFPEYPEVFLSDDATAITLLRKGRFQVELYLIHPNPLVQAHEHPGVEVIKIRAGYGQAEPILMSEPLKKGETHGSNTRLEAEKIGFPLIAIQHWQTRDPTTIASMWRGYTAGPEHVKLIKRFNPDCFVDDLYVDITRKQDGSPNEY